MAIFTAQQATTAVTAYNLAQSRSALNSLISEYQQIFDTISLASGAGADMVEIRMTKYDYNRVRFLLIDNGYTVSDLPVDTILQDDRQVTYTITVTWPTVTVARLTGISPSTFSASKGVASTIEFIPQGGQAPYTWTITGGTLPNGLAYGSLSRVASLTITGTPTVLGTGSVNYTLVDSSGQSFSGNITWSIVTSNTVYLGTTPVELNRASGAITLSDVSITGNAGTVTNGVYTQGDQTLAGVKTFTDGLAGALTGNVLGNLTGNVSGNAGTVTNGVYTNQSYVNPTWITSLDGGKLTGTVVATNGVVTTATYTDPSWLTITKSKVGLANVDNISVATILNNTTLTGTTAINQATLAANGDTANSLVNKAYIDSKIWLALAVGL